MKTTHVFNFRYLLIIAGFSLFLFSCKKDFGDSITTASQSKDGPPNYGNFNWENPINNVMMGALPPGPLNPYLPWTSQTGNYIDASIISDYKSSDGWVLVYNTFDPANYTANAANGGLYFALYNTYRGLLRFYLYIPSGQFGGGQNIQHGLSVYTGTGATTSVLNFDGTDLIDPAINQVSFTKTNNTGVAQAGGWYAMQYEIAYDPNFSNNQFPNLGIAWNSRTINVSQLTVNGSITGNITGNITQQGNDGLGSTIINGALAAAEIYGAGSGTGGWGSTNLTVYQNAASGGLAGNISGFLSGIFGGNSNNSQEVDLKMNASVNLSGILTTPNYLAPNTFVFPGEGIAANNGSNPPLYLSSLGVFNLTQRPIVYGHPVRTQVSATNSDHVVGGYKTTYSIAPLSFVVNPVVSSIANVNIIKQEIVLINPIYQGWPMWQYQTNGNQETIGNYSALTGFSYITEAGNINLTPGLEIAVRLTISVSPTNGTTPPITIVKTFLANVQQN